MVIYKYISDATIINFYDDDIISDEENKEAIDDVLALVMRRILK